MLQAAGFRPDRVRQLRHGDWLRSSARLATRQGDGGVWSNVLRWKPAAKLTAWMCYAIGVSDCMMCVAERPA
jgi:hypothetical protein